MKTKKVTKKVKGRRPKPLPLWEKTVFNIKEKLSAWRNTLRKE